VAGPGSEAHRRRWRGLSVAPLPLLLVLYALWRDLLHLEATGIRLRWETSAFFEWLAMSTATVVVVALFWSPLRPLRVLGYTFYSLVLAFGFGAAFVIAVVHAFGGPGGDMHAPGWALLALCLTCVLCVVSLLAHAALLVDDVRAGDEEGG
jgi:hypothetical protein